ncbi:MAG: PucR family transcriptional regulator [Nocardioides sp.]|jgi:purine catabolism regulator|nr:PucR family transcriptional regulator [Nocardioides sp.]
MNQLTVKWLSGQPGLAISLVAGSAGLEHAIETVHSSEQLDPTPWMQPEELLLTTGMWLTGDETVCVEYVERLARHGAAGIGFGIGIHHDRVPQPMVEAADARGLPLLAVPELTPFSHVLTTVWMAKLRLLQQGMRDAMQTGESLLVAAAEGAGHRTIVERLSTALGADVAWVNPDHRALTGSSAASPDFLEWARDRAGGALAPWPTGVADTRAERTVVLPVVLARRARGALVLRREEPFTAADRHVLKTAVALFRMNLLKEREVLEASLDARSAMLSVALAGNFDLAARIGYDMGLDLPGFPLRVTAVHGRTDLFEVLDELIHNQTLGRRHFAAMHGDRSLVLLSPQDGWPGEALESCLSGLGDLNAATAVAYHSGTFAEAVGRAADAAMSASTSGIVDLDTGFDHAALPLVHDPSHLAWATNVLSPFLELPDRPRGDSLRTLHSWLSNHGNNEATARALRVHRNTLRFRMERIRGLVNGDLDDPDTRAGLWMALRTLDIGSAPPAVREEGP